MEVTRYTVVGLVSLVVVLSMLFPVAGVVAAEPDDEEAESGGHDAGPVGPADETTAGAGEATVELSGDTVETATDTTDEMTANATGTTRDTVDGVRTGPSEDTESVTGDVDETSSNGTDGADRDEPAADPIATVERLSWEVDSVTVTYGPNGTGTVTVVVETDELDDDLQAAPAVLDEVDRLLDAASVDPDVAITLVDADPLGSNVQLTDGNADGDGNASVATGSPAETPGEASDPEARSDDRALAALVLPDIEEPYRYAPAMAAGLFVLLNPLSGLLSGVLAFLAEWAGRLAAVLRYSSRDGSDPLEHETRTRIDDLVTDTPGIALSDLADRLETPLSTVRYHVKILERERHLASRKQRGNRRLYPMDAETCNEELAAAMDNESTATIIESLARQGQATVGDIVDDVGTTYSTVSHHLSRLADAGVVTKEKDGRCTVSKLDPAARTALHRDLDPSTARPATQASGAD